MERNEAIAAIKSALKRRSGKSWSVRGGTGTAWGWITINAPPSRQTFRTRLREGCTVDLPENYEEYDSGRIGGYLSPADRAELAKLLGLDSVHCQGVSIPASYEYRREYVDRAEGRQPSVIGTPYWD